MPIYVLNQPYVEAQFWNGANLRKVQDYVGRKTKITVQPCGTLIIHTNKCDVELQMGSYLIRRGDSRDRHYEIMGVNDFEKLYKKWR